MEGSPEHRSNLIRHLVKEVCKENGSQFWLFVVIIRNSRRTGVQRSWWPLLMPTVNIICIIHMEHTPTVLLICKNICPSSRSIQIPKNAISFPLERSSLLLHTPQIKGYLPFFKLTKMKIKDGKARSIHFTFYLKCSIICPKIRSTNSYLA